MKSIDVVAAIIERNHKVLCVQRGKAKYSYISEKWEFPGGKIEDNENEHNALVREIMEELSMKIKVKEKLMIVKHSYPHFHLTMHIFICSSEDQPILNEHQDFRWLTKFELENLDWAAADIPVIKNYSKI
jgi:8-oxo-dGTP diphosphatase